MIKFQPTTRAFIGLGSNIYPTFQCLHSAITQLKHLPFSRYYTHASFYYTAPIGGPAQAPFINTVVTIDTCLDAVALLSYLQTIEQEHGRTRLSGQLTPWAPRTLDCDLLLFGLSQLHRPTLQIPHPRMKERHFVLAPLYEIAPKLTLPCGTPLRTCLQAPHVQAQHIRKLPAMPTRL